MNLLTFTKEGFGGLLNLIYPPACLICNTKLLDVQQQNLSICEGCLSKIKKNQPPYCIKCGRSLRGLTDNVETCWECTGRDFDYERSWSCTLYEGLTKEALHLLKYSGKLSLSNLFCSLLVQFLEENPEVLNGIEATLAVPLHNVKFRERGFNQAHILSSAVVKKFGLKDLSYCLKRAVATRPQSELDKKERFDNIKGTFEVTAPLLISGKNLLMVDDLFTTGATLNECAKVLRKAGAKKIHCLTFARGS